MENYFYSDSERIKKFDYVEDEDGETIAVPTKEWREYQNEVSLKRRMERVGLNPTVFKYTLDSYIGPSKDEIVPKLKKYVDEFKTKFYGIHLYFHSSKNGTQKSTTAKTIAKEILNQGYQVRFILMSELTKLLEKERFDENVQLQLEQYRSCDLLVLDDSFDKTKITVYKSGYQLPFLDTFLRKRLEVDCKATIFTSNIDPHKIGETGFGYNLQNLILRSVHDFAFKDSYTLKDDFEVSDLWS